MWEALKRLLSPEYLAVADPGPLGGLWVLYLALALLFAAGLAWAVRLLRASPTGVTSTLAWLELWVCLAGLGTVAGRFLGWPGWSARIWPYSLALLALLGAAALRWRAARLPGWLAAQLWVLGLKLNPPAPFPRREGGDSPPLAGERSVRTGEPNPPAPFPGREGGRGVRFPRADRPLPRPLPCEGRGADSPFPSREGGRGVRFQSQHRQVRRQPAGQAGRPPAEG
ncbi:MAG: hypothetical protein EHM56_10315, partial [Chloroflexi bacterium]